MNGPQWWKPTLLALSTSGALLALSIWGMQEPGVHLKKIAMPEDIVRCTTDAECELENQIACCSCRAGGPLGAKRIGQNEALRKFLKKSCRGRTVCMRLDSCQWDLKPRCESGRCVAEVPHD